MNDANVRMVSTDYARTIGMRLKAGRWLNDADGAESQPVVVINEAVARLFWPNENPLGQAIQVWRH